MRNIGNAQKLIKQQKACDYGVYLDQAMKVNVYDQSDSTRQGLM